VDVFGVPLQALSAQLFIGLVNGSFYAVLSLGLAVIFGLLNVVNFAHGALYMMGAFVAWMGLNYLEIGYWWALLVSPLVVGLFGVVLEFTLFRRLYKLDPIYGLLLTFGLSLIIQGLFRQLYGVSGLPYAVPDLLKGTTDVGFMRLPDYRAWVVLASLTASLATWYGIERTRLGAYLRAGMEKPQLVQAFGINLPLIVMLTYGFGAGLAAFAGVLAAPIMQVGPLMGADILVVVFAVVVVGGMGSVMGSVVTGLLLGVVEGLCKVYYPPASNIVIFVIMAVVLLFRPTGLFGQKA
jgi:branched-chain amino acid transport system permease protein